MEIIDIVYGLLHYYYYQTTNFILITCGSLNDPKKTLINGKIHNILRVINLAEIPTFDLIKGQSKWINAVFSEDN